MAFFRRHPQCHLHNIGQKTDITVSNMRPYQEKGDRVCEPSIGASYDECGDYCSVYGEIHYATSLENPGDSEGGGLLHGFRDNGERSRPSRQYRVSRLD
ncbi:hypothetical protein [Microbulbifer marinus]|uniref:Uncharacterized protein n=1 Tax=Microbulbifer marinus TaxID=658218 RepID=A0A1H4B9F7_9GAMM|nr:hypothetical protein [Microbulbifer marinus]SEA44779.1 hypothetical protein SAMN05216562_3137 [Microbulbifer marinus]